MSLASLVIEGLALLGIGAAVFKYGSKLWADMTGALSSWKDSLTSSVKGLVAAPGQAVDYLKTAHDLNSNPDQLITDPVTGARMGGYFGALSTTGTTEQRAQSAAQRANEPKATTIQRLQTEKSLLQSTGQPYLVDTDAGGVKLTLDDISSQLATLGVT